MDCIIDAWVMNVNNKKSNWSKDLHKVLLAAHKYKKKKKYYLGPCLNQPPQFSPFMVSIDGLLAKKQRSISLMKANYLSRSVRSRRKPTPKFADLSMSL